MYMYIGLLFFQQTSMDLQLEQVHEPVTATFRIIWYNPIMWRMIDYNREGTL